MKNTGWPDMLRAVVKGTNMLNNLWVSWQEHRTNRDSVEQKKIHEFKLDSIKQICHKGVSCTVPVFAKVDAMPYPLRCFLVQDENNFNIKPTAISTKTKKVLSAGISTQSNIISISNQQLTLRARKKFYLRRFYIRISLPAYCWLKFRILLDWSYRICNTMI